MRQTLIRLVDSYSAQLQRYRSLLEVKGGSNLAQSFRTKYRRGEINRSVMSMMLSRLARDGRWPRMIAILLAAKAEGMSLDLRWYDTVLQTAREAGKETEADSALKEIWTEKPIWTSTTTRLPSASTVAVREGGSELQPHTNGALQAIQSVVVAPKSSLTSIQPELERFAITQQLVRSGDELALLLESLEARPRSAFRISVCRPEWPFIVASASEYPALKRLSWYPGYAFLLDESAAHTDVHRARQFISAAMECNQGSFQSLSSLIPPLLLQPTQDDRILDLCAAPGSKTSQTLDLANGHAGSGRIGGEGFVIANDIDPNRLRDLRRRIGGTSLTLGITRGIDSQSGLPNRPLFHKALVDVMCSGDGVRQKTGSWADWYLSMGNSYHSQQVRCLRTALNAVQPGGTVVYSTCTLNPLECEAVVQTVLAEGLAEVVPAPERLLPIQLPSAVTFAEGLTQWRVPVRSADGATIYLDDASSAADHRDVVTPTMFSSSDQVLLRSLRQCRRILPHRAAGFEAFFFAVLRRPVHSYHSVSSGGVTGEARTENRRPLPASPIALRSERQSRHGHTVIPFDRWASPLLSGFGIPRDALDGRVELLALEKGSTTSEAAPMAFLTSKGLAEVMVTTDWKSLLGRQVGLPFIYPSGPCRSLLYDAFVDRQQQSSIGWMRYLTFMAINLLGPLATSGVVEVEPDCLQLLLSLGKVNLHRVTEGTSDPVETFRQQKTPLAALDHRKSWWPALTPLIEAVQADRVGFPSSSLSGPTLMKVRAPPSRSGRVPPRGEVYGMVWKENGVMELVGFGSSNEKSTLLSALGKTKGSAQHLSRGKLDSYLSVSIPRQVDPARLVGVGNHVGPSNPHGGPQTPEPTITVF